MVDPSTWEPPDAEIEPPWQSSQPWSDSHSAPAFHGAVVVCETCRDPEAYAYYEDPCYDTDTDTDDGEEDKTLSYWLTRAAESPGGMDHLTQHVLDTYTLYKKRWRRIAGRSTRHQRFTRRPKGKGKGQGKVRAHLCRTCSSYYDWQTEGTDYVFAAGKGFGGKGASRKGSMNKVGKDGQVMKCHICGSEYHLKDRCPRNNEGIRAGFTTMAHAITDTSVSRPPSIQENHNDVDFTFVVMLYAL